MDYIEQILDALNLELEKSENKYKTQVISKRTEQPATSMMIKDEDVKGMGYVFTNNVLPGEPNKVTIFDKGAVIIDSDGFYSVKVASSKNTTLVIKRNDKKNIQIKITGMGNDHIGIIEVALHNMGDSDSTPIIKIEQGIKSVTINGEVIDPKECTVDNYMDIISGAILNVGGTESINKYDCAEPALKVALELFFKVWRERLDSSIALRYKKLEELKEAMQRTEDELSLLEYTVFAADSNKQDTK